MIKRTRFGKGYSASFDTTNGRILRVVEDDLTHSPTPELYDIEITNKCLNNCPYCYMNSSEEGTKHMSLETIKDLFENKLKGSPNLLPFQVALGGGEPILHPKFVEIIKYIRGLGVVPNYTTSGVGLNPYILLETERNCGGIALTYHPHLGEKVFREALLLMKENLKKVKVNVHLVIDNDSIDLISYLLNKYSGMFSKLVLINFKPLGRGEHLKDKLITKEKELELLAVVKKYIDTGVLAFDAGFIPFFTSYHRELNRTYRQIAPNFRNIEAVYNAFIDVDYNIKPSSFYSSKGISLEKEDLIDIWNNNELFTDIRLRQATPKDECVNCNVFDLCKGGIYDPGMKELKKVNFCKNKVESEEVNENFTIYG